MVTIKIVCIGNLKEKFLKDAFSEYKKRLGPFCKLKLEEIPEYKVSCNPSESEIKLAITSEGEKILSKVDLSNYIIALCVEGREFSSTSFSKQIEKVMLMGKSSITFIIGGSFGLSSEVKSIANLSLSISKMTFTHQFSRIILIEQIYRVFQILNGGKYHK